LDCPGWWLYRFPTLQFTLCSPNWTPVSTAGAGDAAGAGAGGWLHLGMEQLGKLTTMLLCKHIP